MKKIIVIVTLFSGFYCYGMDILSFCAFAPKGIKINPMLICAQVIESFKPGNLISANKRNNIDIHITFCPHCSELFAKAKPNIPTLKDLKALGNSKL